VNRCGHLSRRRWPRAIRSCTDAPAGRHVEDAGEARGVRGAGERCRRGLPR
jgi:hypothetical protein